MILSMITTERGKGELIRIICLMRTIDFVEIYKCIRKYYDIYKIY